MVGNAAQSRFHVIIHQSISSASSPVADISPTPHPSYYSTTTLFSHSSTKSSSSYTLSIKSPSYHPINTSRHRMASGKIPQDPLLSSAVPKWGKKSLDCLNVAFDRDNDMEPLQFQDLIFSGSGRIHSLPRTGR